jgi:SAM-dependent methyltransferase
MTVRNIIGHFQRLLSPTQLSAPDLEGKKSDENIEVASLPKPLDHSMLGLHDAVLSGWFLNDTNEVFKGLPVTADDVVLDVGCGDGGVARFCAARGAAIILADSDSEKVASAERFIASAGARSIQTVVSQSNPLPLADGVASIVISTEVLEHVDDPAEFLAELFRVGCSGARYLITVPDAAAETLQKSPSPITFALSSAMSSPQWSRMPVWLLKHRLLMASFGRCGG